jgi:hypothetical protein
MALKPPRYSDDSKLSVALLYRPYNDIEVYIEDDAGEELYRQILSKTLPEGVRVRRVVSLGGRSGILKELARYDGCSLPPRFFILDGDLDNLVGNERKLPNHAFRLTQFCIENYLLQEEAVCDIIHDQHCRTSLGEVAARIGFAAWMEQAVEMLSPLFACFAFLQGVVDPPRNTSAIYRMATNKRGELDARKVGDSLLSLTAEAESRTTGATVAIHDLLMRMGPSWQERKAHISGKALLVCLLGHANRLLPKYKLHTENFRFRLAKRCEYPELQPLGRAMISVLRTSQATRPDWPKPNQNRRMPT